MFLRCCFSCSVTCWVSVCLVFANEQQLRKMLARKFFLFRFEWDAVGVQLHYRSWKRDLLEIVSMKRYLAEVTDHSLSVSLGIGVFFIVASYCDYCRQNIMKVQVSRWHFSTYMYVWECLICFLERYGLTLIYTLWLVIHVKHNDRVWQGSKGLIFRVFKYKTFQ